jgi:hypothetical protein
MNFSGCSQKLTKWILPTKVASMKRGLKSGIILILIILVGLAAFWVVPRLLYKIPLFQGWVAGQINEQSGGAFEFDGIQGDAKIARLTGPWLDLTKGTSNVLQARFDELTATFELLPVATLNLDLKEIVAKGGEVLVDLRGGGLEQIVLPVNAETFSMTGGRLAVQNVQGYHLILNDTSLQVESTADGMKGTFSSPGGTAGTIQLEGVEGSFEFGPQGLTVPSFKARIPGASSLSIKGNLDLNSEGMPMEGVTLSVDTEQVQTLLDSLGYSKSFDGSAVVQAEISGRFRPELKALQGKGNAELFNIRAAVDLPNYPGFDGSGILQDLKTITGLAGKADFTLEGDQITINPLQLKNEQMEISGTAGVGFNHQLSGDQTLLASSQLAAGIPDVAKGVFKKNESGQTVIPFKFIGTTNEPATKTDSVISKTLMNPVNTVKSAGGFLGGLFGGGKKNDEDTSTEIEEAQPAPQ